MNHLSDEMIILAYYGEALDDAARTHLAGCSTCRQELRSVSATLDTLNDYPAPEPPPAFEQMLWRRISPTLKPAALAPPAIRHWWRTWMLAPGLACLLIASFLVGRWSMDRPHAAPLLSGISDTGRERILLVALGDHLERSQMVLVEIANSKPSSSAAFHLTQQRAQNLVGENRLYRQTALLTGDTEFSDLLDELERVLTDIANRPSELTSPELEQIQRRIESRGLLFKIRVTGSNLQQKGSEKL